MGKTRIRRRIQKTTIPLAVVGGFLPLANRGMVGYKGNGLYGLGDGILSGLTGYSTFEKKWNPNLLWQGTIPILMGFGVHKIAGRLGINRALSRAGIPLIRI